MTSSPRRVPDTSHDVTGTQDPMRPSRRRWAGPGRLLADNSAVVGVLALGLVMSTLTPVFARPQNLLNVSEQAAVVALLAVGLTFVIVTGGIDLSVGSVAALAAVVAGLTPIWLGVPGWLGLVTGLLSGAALGAINGFLVAVWGFPSFVVTLAMLSVARGLTLVISDGRPVQTTGAIDVLGGDLTTAWGGVPVPLVLALGVGAVAAFALGRTPWGRWVYAIGGNASAARRVGIPTRSVLVGCYTASGTCAGLAGLVIAGRLTSAQPQAASGDELAAISAVVIGGASLAGGYGLISGALAGALLLSVIRNSLNLLNVDAFWQQVAIGVIVLAAVAVDQLRRRRVRLRYRRRSRAPSISVLSASARAPMSPPSSSTPPDPPIGRTS